MSDRRQEKLDYLQHCVTENLNHARHVENERLTFTSIYIAMVIGAVAAIFAMDDRTVAIIVAGFLMVFGLMAMLLNMRWQGVFDDHIHAAKVCQEEWEQAASSGNCPNMSQKGYCYTYEKHDNIWQGFRRLVGAPVEDARAKQIRRLKRKFNGTQAKNKPMESLEKRCKKLLGEELAGKLLAEWNDPPKAKPAGEPLTDNEQPKAKPAGEPLTKCNEPPKEKPVPKKTVWIRLGEMLSAFFKEMGRTRRIFALLYLIVFIALFALLIYLCLAEDYGGFFFADEVIDRLADAIGLIVEETQK